MGRGEFYRYFMPEKKPDHVALRVCNIYGFMETGKSVLSRKIGARIEKRCEEKKWGFLFIEARRQQDALLWIEEHKDEIRGLDYVMLLYDDAGRFFMSREGTTKERRQVLKDYMEIRHILERHGFRQGVLGILFNVQFYRLLDKTMRNAPMTIWKSSVIMDPEDKREFVIRVGRRYYYFLKIITKAMFIDGYKLKYSDIRIRSSAKREEIYQWLYQFFINYNIDPTKGINSEFVKRFALVELFDDKFIIDTGNDISTPQNYVKIEYIDDNNDIFTPRDMEERDKMVALFYAGYRIARFFPDMKKDQLLKYMRKGLGIRIMSKKFYDLSKEVDNRIESMLEEAL